MGRYLEIARGVSADNNNANEATELKTKVQRALDWDELYDLLALSDVAVNAGDISRDEGDGLLRLAIERSREVLKNGQQVDLEIKDF